MPCEHEHHIDTASENACSLRRIAEALESLNGKLPDLSSPKHVASFVKEADKLVNE